MYYIFLRPALVSLETEGNSYFIEGFIGDDHIVHIRFGDQCFRDFEDFTRHAYSDLIDGESLFCERITGIQLVRWD